VKAQLTRLTFNPNNSLFNSAVCIMSRHEQSGLLALLLGYSCKT